jgi:hypothetical protein
LSSVGFDQYLKEAGYSLPVPVANNRWLAVQRQAYTTGLFLIDDGDLAGYRCRWCFASDSQAVASLLTWDAEGDDPGGPWIKQKGRDSRGQPVDRLNPRLADPEADF